MNRINEINVLIELLTNERIELLDKLDVTNGRVWEDVRGIIRFICNVSEELVYYFIINNKQIENKSCQLDYFKINYCKKLLFTEYNSLMIKNYLKKVEN